MSDEAALDTGVKNRKPSLIAYQVRDGKDEQSYWDRIGVAWSNRDGGFTVQLHSIPLDVIGSDNIPIVSHLHPVNSSQGEILLAS
jgi:hypothetical protein